MTNCPVYSMEGFKEAFPVQVRAIELMGTTEKKVTFTPQAIVVVNSSVPIYKTPNAEIRSWARKNLRGKYARRILYRDAPRVPNGNSMVDIMYAALFFFATPEDAVTFSLHAAV